MVQLPKKKKSALQVTVRLNRIILSDESIKSRNFSQMVECPFTN